MRGSILTASHEPGCSTRNVRPFAPITQATVTLAGKRGGSPVGTLRAALQTAPADGSVGTRMWRRRASRTACNFSRLSRFDATFWTTRVTTALVATPPPAAITVLTVGLRDDPGAPPSPVTSSISAGRCAEDGR